jgi:hypothetical protein
VDAKAAGAYVTLSIREDMRQGLAQAQAKIAAFADFASKRTANILDFGKLGNFLVSGAVVGVLSKLAMQNEHVAASAQKANEQFQQMFDLFLSENAGAVSTGFEALSFVLNKLVNGFRAIVALVRDLGDVITATSFGFDNFNQVLDTLDPEPMNKQAAATVKVSDAMKIAALSAKQLTDAQRELNAATLDAQTAGMGDINRLIREQDVSARGETAVRADEIYKETLDAQLRLIDAQRIANRDEAAAAAERARNIAEARREQFLFLEDQKKAREETAKAQEEELARQQRLRDEAAKAAEEKQRELAMRGSGAQVSGVSGTFALQAAGGNIQYQTQRDMLRELREQKALQKQQLEAQREANRRPGARFQ